MVYKGKERKTLEKLPPIEITLSISGKIPRRQFENYSPMVAITEFMPASTTDEVRNARLEALKAQLGAFFSDIRDKIRLEEVQDQFKTLRFTGNPDDGKKYPHVTDILYWDADFYIAPGDLAQYGARGSAIHAMIDNWIATGSKGGLKSNLWDMAAINKRDAILLKNGSLRLWDSLDSINFIGFIEKYGKDLEFGEGEFRAFNAEHFYCGKPDRVGKYLGAPAIFDWKCREAKDDDFKQMAAYLKLEDPRLANIEQMVIVPLNPDNKSGYGKPVISKDVEKYFNLFLRDRNDYREKFGI